MTRIIEDIEAHYETLEVPFGRIYEWHPEHIIVECGCGERFTLSATSTTTTCRCGIDHGAILRNIERHADPLSDKISHPWRYNDVTAGLGDERRSNAGPLHPLLRKGKTNAR